MRKRNYNSIWFELNIFATFLALCGAFNGPWNFQNVCTSSELNFSQKSAIENWKELNIIENCILAICLLIMQVRALQQNVIIIRSFNF
jgi:hypothetical protein